MAQKDLHRSVAGRLLPILILALVAVVAYFALIHQDLEPPRRATLAQIRRMVRDEDFASARENLQQRLKESPGDPELTLLIVQACHGLNEFEEALSLAEGFTDVKSEAYVDLRIRGAMIGVQHGYPDQTERLLRQAIKARPLNPTPHRVLTRLYHMLRNRPAVQRQIASMDRMRIAVARDALMYNPGGEVGWEDASYVDWLENSRVGNPDNLYVVAALARALPRLDRTEERRRLLTEFESFTDSCWTLALEVAAESLSARQPAKALRILSRTEADAELAAEVWLLRARALKQLKANQQYEACLRNARILSPNDPAAVEPLLQYYEQKGLPEKARRLRDLRAPLDRYRLLVKNFFESNGRSAAFEEIAELLTGFGQIRAAEICGSGVASEQRANSRGLPAPSVELLAAVDVSSFLQIQSSEQTPLSSLDVAGIHLKDVAGESGIDFTFVNAKCEQDILLKSLGGGVAVFDFDNDSWPDLYFGQGDRNAESPTSEDSTDVLYRNLRGERFSQVSSRNAASTVGYSHGMITADFDNDGFSDVFVCRFGKNRLLANNGDGTFNDITDTLPVSRLWSTSAAFLDVDRDGDLDLYVASYVDAGFQQQVDCNVKKGAACTLREFAPDHDEFFVNDGDGRFRSASALVRGSGKPGSGLGVLALDYDRDGFQDVFVGNDTTPNSLLRNTTAETGEPGFRDMAAQVGVAVGRSGRPQACMGIACADVDRNGWFDLLVTNFENQPNAVYMNSNGLFEEASERFEMANASLRMLSWGTQFADINADGFQDAVIANGHLYDQPMPLQVFVNNQGLRFETVSSTAASIPSDPHHGRATALIDFDRNGQSDFVVSNIGERARLIRNATPQKTGRLIRLVGTSSPRTAEGAVLELVDQEGRTEFRRASTGGGLFCTNDDVIVIPDTTTVQRIYWPSGVISTKANRFATERVTVIVEATP